MAGGWIEKAVALAGRGGRLLMATADPAGVPHLATASTIEADPEGRLVVTAWFCSETIRNLAANRHAALVVWLPAAGGAEPEATGECGSAAC